MSKYLEEIVEKIKEKKKKIIKRASILVALVAGISIAGGVALYSIAKSNINYTVEEAKDIALQSVKGEVLRVYKRIELDTLSFEYEFKIKDTNNMLKEVGVDSSLGVITDLDNYYD